MGKSSDIASILKFAGKVMPGVVKLTTRKPRQHFETLPRCTYAVNEPTVG